MYFFFVTIITLLFAMLMLTHQKVLRLEITSAIELRSSVWCQSNSSDSKYNVDDTPAFWVVGGFFLEFFKNEKLGTLLQCSNTEYHKTYINDHLLNTTGWSISRLIELLAKPADDSCSSHYWSLIWTSNSWWRNEFRFSVILMRLPVQLVCNIHIMEFLHKFQAGIYP